MNDCVVAKSTHISTELTSFVQQRQRLPRLGDDPPPWRYPGWLLAYVILIHARCHAVADRWGYHLRTLEAGRLLDDPIPQIQFGAADNGVFAMLRKWTSLIGRDCGGWSDFRTLLDWLSWGLALCDDELRMSDEVQEKLYRQVNLGPLLEGPHDYLGAYVATEKARGWNPTAFHPTPHSIVECMVRMTMCGKAPDVRDPRTWRVCDPAVGSGRMLLHASNRSLSLWGQDVDPLAVTMCKINGALYAPWLAFPLPSPILGRKATSTSVSASLTTPVAEMEELPLFETADLLPAVVVTHMPNGGKGTGSQSSGRMQPS